MHDIKKFLNTFIVNEFEEQVLEEQVTTKFRNEHFIPQ